MTRAGRLLLAGALIALVAGRIFGLDEVELLAISMLLLLVAARIWVQVRRPNVAIDRRLAPARVSAGDPSNVELSVRATGRRASPPITLVDPVTGTAGAIVSLSSIHPDHPVEATYALPTEQRGIIWVGPLQLEVTDPFGLAVVHREAAARRRLTVLPRVDPIAPVRSGRGDDPLGEVSRGDRLSPAGDEFAALRPYVVGDELRRVHWRTSARLDVLMTRREERPWQGRCTVLLDVRSSAHTPASLERAVSAAASVAAASIQRDESVRLLTTNGLDSGHGSGRTHLDEVLEELAVVGPGPDSGFGPALSALRGAATGGSLVLLTTPNADVSTLHLLTRSFPAVVVVAFVPGAAEEAAARGRRWMARVDAPGPVEPVVDGRDRTDADDPATSRWSGVGTLTITVPAAVSFAAAWEAAMGPVTRPSSQRSRAAHRRPSWSAR